MVLRLNGQQIELVIRVRREDSWTDVTPADGVRFVVEEEENWLRYRLELTGDVRTQVRLYARVAHAAEAFHVIPCCIYGDNNARLVQSGEFPLLTEETDDDVFRSPFWAFRADRAAMPLSAICTEAGALAVTIDPYSATPEGEIHNGVFAALPDVCGVSLGYTNEPISFINKRTPGPSTAQDAFCTCAEGRIYYVVAADPERPRQALHEIIRREYALRHERAEYQRTFEEAVEGCLTSLSTISWNEEAQEYSNCDCLPPENPVLRPWRSVKEIGWTGGGVLAYPLILADAVLGDRAAEIRGSARTGSAMFDKIAGAYNEASGLINDLTSPIDESGSLVNGWWSAFGLTKDVHCSYNVGSAVHYMLKAVVFCQSRGMTVPASWLEISRRTMDTVISLQREDGAFGYTFRIDRPEVVDWDGYAGCWFVPCAAYLYHLTGEEQYLQAADRALQYYGTYVDTLTCCATPMDTWKSPDEEGNLAFIRGARLLHEYTGRQEYLDALQRAVDYECLWRYGYRTHPENYPIRDGWNSCGGSITSVSNPHIHPMGMIVDSDLYYLGRVTGDAYYTDRALDGTAWLMQTLERYPAHTTYGRYGVLSERWCPSDGLVVQRDSTGAPYSSWFSFNLWAGAAALEEVCERALEIV